MNAVVPLVALESKVVGKKTGSGASYEKNRLMRSRLAEA